MKYQGYFKSLSDKEYKVEIVTDGSSRLTREIILGATPFTTQQSASGDTIYNPIKASSATIQIVSNPMYFDLYSSSAKEDTVKLIDTSTNDIVWCGYTKPNIYNSAFNYENETYEVEALDPLAILQYYDYETIGETKGFVTFTQIIDKMLSKVGLISKWYVSTNTKISNVNGNLNDLCTISEQNFFDEDNEAMNMQEVLEEICKFCGVTAVCVADSVYFIDYDAIKHGHNTYARYSVGNTTSLGTINFIQNPSLSKESYRAANTTISLDNVYTKATVKDSLYNVESILPKMFEDEDLVSSQDYPDGSTNWYYTYDSSCYENGKYINIKSRQYTNKRFNHYYYTNRGVQTEGPIENILDAEDKLGISFARYAIGKGENDTAAYNNIPFEFEDYLMIPINNSASSVVNVKRLETKATEAKPFFIDSNTKFVVKGSMILTDRGTFKSFNHEFPFPIPVPIPMNIGYFPDTEDLKGDYDGWKFLFIEGGNSLKISKNLLTLKVGLSIGDSSIVEEVPFYESGTGDDTLEETKKSHEIFYHSFDIQDNIGYSDRIDEDGYKLPISISPSSVIAAKPIISIWGMENFWRGISIDWLAMPVACCFIKDFDVVALMPHDGGKDENDTDTEYSYIIDDEYVSKLGDIEFKICTWDNKQLNYSSVAYRYGTNYKYVDTLRNNSITGPAGETDLKSEWWMCYKIVNQYRTPAKKLSLTLKNDILPWAKVYDPVTDTNYIVNTMTHNYANDSCEYELTEKK